MKNKLLLLTTVISTALIMPVASADDNVLTGDRALACEAILCLSSGDRPQECANSLRRYFGIKHKKPWKTLSARKDFLNLCPSSNEKDMPELVNALVNGAGRCDAAELNRVMRSTYEVKECRRINRETNACEMVKKTYIRNAKPDYCKTYFEHGWITTGEKLRYVGSEKNGGRWVE